MAVQVTFVVPIGNVLPDAGAHTGRVQRSPRIYEFWPEQAVGGVIWTRPDSWDALSW